MVESAGTEFRQSLASLSAPYQRGSDWARVREDAIVFPPARSKRGSKGPRSLVAMCLRVLADNIAAASRDSIWHLPEHLKWALWRELYPRNMAFQTWKIVSGVLWGASYIRADSGTNKPHDEAFLMSMFRYCQEIVNPPCDLSVYTAPFMEMETDLVYLCIDNVARFQTHELISLAKLPQLVVLELIERDAADSRIGDGLIQGWSEVDIMPFRHLRVLKITSRTHWVSERRLEFFLELPRLEILDITATPKSRLRTSSRVKDIVARCGWKITEPSGSLFVSYAEAYLDGRIAVHPVGVEGLKGLFENDRQRVSWVDEPRWLIYQQWEKDVEQRAEERDAEGRPSRDEPDPEEPDFRDYIDDNWQALLRGDHPLSANASPRTRHPEEMSDDQVFWFLALLDQKNRDAKIDDVVQEEAAGVTLPIEQFISLRLRNPSNTGGQTRRLLNSERLIFSRCREAAAARSRSATAPRPEASEVERHRDPAPSSFSRREDPLESSQEDSWESREEDSQHHAPAPSWVPRPDDRREKDLKPRKRQKRSAGDLLSSFGVPQGKTV
ncbi:hypothetical protein C8A01DRAFT_13467 [Parachaetomium inaequale]|uniref:Uncharacterized protein n=1 Tax=Parachaetomium inaequale TaxID=2588326 RepID=A0AAN6PLI6_9PEZI|nr:hypothetical protein C8A01DRAFT_13467 [Parachaetomium inaequale]